MLFYTFGFTSITVYTFALIGFVFTFFLLAAGLAGFMSKGITDENEVLKKKNETLHLEIEKLERYIQTEVKKVEVEKVEKND